MYIQGIRPKIHTQDLELNWIANLVREFWDTYIYVIHTHTTITTIKTANIFIIIPKFSRAMLALPLPSFSISQATTVTADKFTVSGLLNKWNTTVCTHVDWFLSLGIFILNCIYDILCTNIYLRQRFLWSYSESLGHPENRKQLGSWATF